jgi:hypothetical protein
MSQSTLQSSIASAPKCALILFAAGTYNITGGLTLPCGVTITAAVPATPSNVVLSASFAAESTDIFTLNGGCTDQTTVAYLSALHAGLLLVNTPNSNLTFTHNQVGDLKCCHNQAFDTALYITSPGANASNMLTNATVTWNTLGDSTSCLSPQNAMTDTDSPEDYQGVCAGLQVQTSVNGMVIENNNINHVGEGVHILCSGNCYPGYLTQNMTVQFNDFNQIHRIPWEQQPQQSSGVVFQYNSIHDWVDPYFGSFGVSFACCGQGATGPYLNVSNNVIVLNTSPSGRYGYGSEDWGAGGIYNNNWIGSGNVATSIGMAWGYGSPTSMSNNTVCGGGFSSAGYITTEGFSGVASPTMTGNVTGSTCKAAASVAPTISPAAGGQTYPLTVKLTDAGYTSGPQPLGNTGVWYTTDGSTPTPGSGTAQYVASGGTITLNAPATVKAVGMWGAANQPPSYAAGFGFVPSNVVSAAYSATGSIQRPVATASSSDRPTGKLAAAAGASSELPASAASATLESVAITPSQPVVAIGSTTQLKAIATFNDGSVKDVSADFTWQSSDVRTMTANAAGVLAGVASGKATISGSYQGLQASVSANSSIGEVAWSDPIVITQGGTYTGNWQSTDAKTPAVTVATAAPVTIENAHIRSVGGLIKTSVAGANLTVRNSLGVALNAAVKGQPNGVFLEVTSPARLDVESNYIENAQGGVIVHGYAGSQDGEQTIVIRSNRARNMNGLLSDGNGGYLAGEGASRSQARFIQFDSLQSVPGVDVGWNEVVNYPGLSLVADNIDVYRSGGTANRPLEIHDTYIQGAYPYRAQDAYDGGGIKTDAKAGDSAQEVPAFNSIHDNQVVGTVNYGIQFAAGHDNVASNNRVISSGLLADGTKIAAQDVGLADGSVGNAKVYNNTMHDNLVGWTCWKSSCAPEGYRKDQFFPASPADYSTNSVLATRQITFDMENNEYQIWLDKMSAAGITVGPSF